MSEVIALPDAVYSMLRRSRFVHLATCSNDVPSVSLMSFTLLSAEDAPAGIKAPCLILATPKNTVKFANIVSNPKVSLLVHDWVGLTQNQSNERQDNIASYLQALNAIELAQQSVTFAGLAHVLKDAEAESLRALHLARHPDARCFILDAEIIAVELTGATLADSKNHVQKF